MRLLFLSAPWWRGIFTVWVCSALLGAGSASAQALTTEPSDDALTISINQERARIAQERAAVQSRFQDLQQACRARFFVSSCLRALNAQERQALSGLRQRELTIEQAERQRRHDAALKRLAERADDERQRAASAQETRLRQQQALQAQAQEQARREAEARSRAVRQADRAREVDQRRQARERAAHERRRDTPPLPGPSAGGNR